MRRLVALNGTLLVLQIVSSSGASATAALDEFEVPSGFEVSLFAGDDLAHDIFSMTTDDEGRVVVAGRGYVKVLHDDDGDGHADRAALFSEKPASGAHGMYFAGGALICTGDGGLWKITDTDGDGRGDRHERWSPLRHPEHGSNGVVRGPDGWFYVICGNDAGVTGDHAATPGSPVKEPRCGAVVRFSSDGGTSEVLAHGFRNPYDIDFGPLGHMFTVDADGERDYHLPWYSPNRLFDIAQGMEHGWLLEGWTRSWNRAPWFSDNVERLVEVGRGSPTGVTVYRHRQFPARYRRGVFSLCWTFGRVYFHRLERRGATFDGEMEVFMKTAGNVGFAPVDLAVGAAGDLFVAIGGRGTRGSVFRVRYTGNSPAAGDEIEELPALEAVLDAPQPLSSWSRRRWMPAARALGKDAFEEATANTALSSARRIRAVEILTELFGGLAVGAAREALAAGDLEVAARVAWALSRGSDSRGRESRAAGELLVELTRSSDPRVARSAWESIAALPALDAGLHPDWKSAVESDERRVRWAALLAARSRAAASFAHFVGEDRDPSPRGRLARLWVPEPLANLDADPGAYVDTCLAVAASSADVSARAEAVRLLEVALGDIRTQQGSPDVYAGYSGNRPDHLTATLRRRVADELQRVFPSGFKPLDHEVARLFSMLSASGPLPVDTQWTEESSPVDDVHYLIVASRLPGKRSPPATKRAAEMLIRLHGKLEARRMLPSRNWPLRVGEAVGELLRRDPALGPALVGHADFGSRADHSLFATLLKGKRRQRAAGRLLDGALARSERGQQAWTPELIRIVAELPAERSLPALRAAWGDPLLDDTIAIELAAHHRPEDRKRFVAALGSSRARVVERAAAALAAIGGAAAPGDVVEALRALKRFVPVRQADRVMRALGDLLRVWTGRDVEPDGAGEPLDLYRSWAAWFAGAHPDEARALSGLAGAGGAAWKTRLAAIDWEDGNAERGKAVFEKKSCHLCHVGAQRLGPELRGVASRFSREDLFEALVNPDKDVSPLYQPTEVVTRSGRVYTGLMIYESPTGTLLQTGPDETVRVTGDEVLVRRPGKTSIMPGGMLDDLDDRALADLYAYLLLIGK